MFGFLVVNQGHCYSVSPGHEKYSNSLFYQWCGFDIKNYIFLKNLETFRVFFYYIIIAKV